MEIKKCLAYPGNLYKITSQKPLIIMGTSEMGIYKRKQESKKTRKHAFDQESDQEKRKHALEQKSDQEKKKRSFFQDCFFWSRACFFSFFLLSCFLL